MLSSISLWKCKCLFKRSFAIGDRTKRYPARWTHHQQRQRGKLKMNLYSFAMTIAMWTCLYVMYIHSYSYLRSVAVVENVVSNNSNNCRWWIIFLCVFGLFHRTSLRTFNYEQELMGNSDSWKTNHCNTQPSEKLLS